MPANVTLLTVYWPKVAYDDSDFNFDRGITMINDVKPVSVEDYRRRAKRKLLRFLFDYVDGGANDQKGGNL